MYAEIWVMTAMTGPLLLAVLTTPKKIQSDDKLKRDGGNCFLAMTRCPTVEASYFFTMY